MQRVAVVTGGNKGIGYAIVKDLCRKFDGIVYLTARNADLGTRAVANLKKDGYDPKYHQLDIDDVASIKAFADHIKNTHGGLDVLVNNAAIAYKQADTAPFAKQAEHTIRVNFFDTLNVCKELFPLLRAHARVVNISSSAGMLERVPNPLLREELTSLSLSEAQLCRLMESFVNDAKIGKHEESGWPNSAYSVSKVGVTALSMLQQTLFDKDPREDIVVNAVHPGYVDTDMTSHKGPLSPDEGAVAPSWLALLPPNITSPKGQMIWNDKTIVKWGPY